MMSDNLFKHEAKTIVDTMFNAKAFHDNITRDDLNSIESYLSDIMQMQYDSHIRMSKFLDKIRSNVDAATIPTPPPPPPQKE